MNGCVIPNTPIAVDFWKIRQCPSARVFFLSHLHGDHIVGLSSSWKHKIYCSEVSAKILKEKYDLEPSLVCTLEMGSSHIIYLDPDEQEQMTVTTVDANHCPGAVMFIFEGYFGKILYTGDFRWNEQMEADLFCQNLDNLDVLYLDNTYCSPSCQFPSREEAMEQIISILKNHRDHDIVIGLRSLGKENILIKIAEEFKEWISLPGDMYNTAVTIDLPEIFCVNEINCRVRVEPFYSISNKNMDKWNEIHPTIAILPTALYTGLDMAPFINRQDVFIVPYSDHSSYLELVECVKLLSPKVIYPIVKEDTKGPFGCNVANRSDMSCFSQYLDRRPRTEVVIPDSVKSSMLNRRGASPQKPRQKRKRKIFHKKERVLRQCVRGVQYDYASSDNEDSRNDSFDGKSNTSSVSHLSNDDPSNRESPQMVLKVLSEVSTLNNEKFTQAVIVHGKDGEQHNRENIEEEDLPSVIALKSNYNKEKHLLEYNEGNSRENEVKNKLPVIRSRSASIKTGPCAMQKELPIISSPVSSDRDEYVNFSYKESTVSSDNSQEFRNKLYPIFTKRSACDKNPKYNQDMNTMVQKCVGCRVLPFSSVHSSDSARKYSVKPVSKISMSSLKHNTGETRPCVMNVGSTVIAVTPEKKPRVISHTVNIKPLVFDK